MGDIAMLSVQWLAGESVLMSDAADKRNGCEFVRVFWWFYWRRCWTMEMCVDCDDECQCSVSGVCPLSGCLINLQFVLIEAWSTLTSLRKSR